MRYLRHLTCGMIKSGVFVSSKSWNTGVICNQKVQIWSCSCSGSRQDFSTTRATFSSIPGYVFSQETTRVQHSCSSLGCRIPFCLKRLLDDGPAPEKKKQSALGEIRFLLLPSDASLRRSSCSGSALFFFLSLSLIAGCNAGPIEASK